MDNKTDKTPKNGQSDEIPMEQVFSRTIRAGADAVLYNEQVTPQIIQMVQSGATPAYGLGLALMVLLSGARNSIVEQGKPVPSDLLFMEGGAAEMIAQDIAELAQVPPDAIPEAVQVAQQMMLETDESAAAGASQGASGAPQGGGGNPLAQAAGMAPQGATGGSMGGGGANPLAMMGGMG